MKRYLSTIVLITYALIGFSQGVGINDDGSMPVDGAILDVKSTTQGMLIPRMTEAQRDAISPDTQSMLIYQTNNDSGFYFYNGSAWTPFLIGGAAANSGWSTTGNSGTTVGTHFLGTTDAEDFAIHTNNSEAIRVKQDGNVGIGTTTPNRLLHVNGVIRSDSHIEEVDGTGSGSFNMISASNLLHIDVGGTGHSTDRIHIGDLNTADNNMTMFGNIGIGTENPITKLEISGDDPIVIIRDTNEVVNETAMLSFNTGSNGTAFSDLNRIGSIRAIIKGTSPLLGALEFRTNRGDNTDPMMYIQEDGNVGIGPTTPNAKLAVETATAGSLLVTLADESSDANSKSGNISVNHYTNTEEPFLLISGTSSATNNTVGIGGNVAAANAATDIRFYTAANQTTVTGSERMRIVSDGNVGVNTTSPDALLDVNGNASFAADNISIGSTTGAAGERANLNYFGGSAKFTIKGLTGVNTSIGANNTDDYIYIKTDGNVGIGTTTPGTKLEVNGGAFLRNLAAIGRANTTWDTQGYEMRLNAQAGTPPLLIESNDTDLMVVDANGNLGLGISSPTYELDVADGNSTQISIRATTEAVNNQGELLFTTSTGNNANTQVIASIRGIITQATPSALKGAMGFRVNGGDNTGYAMYIQDDTNVGIGTLTPNAKLQVAGSVNCTGGTCTSDMRWKKDIQTLDNALEKVLEMRGVNYYWRSEEFVDKGFNNRKQIGVIAQEVEKIYPELIITDQEGYKSMDYMSLSAVLLEAIKEQQQIIESQNQKFAGQEIINQELKAEIEEIKTILNQTGKR